MKKNYTVKPTWIKSIFTGTMLVVGLFSINTSKAQQCSKPPIAKVDLGANIGALGYYDKNRVFNDVFKTSKSFSTDTINPWSATAPVPPLDADGWPLSDFGVVVMGEMDSTMRGIYTIKFKGKANIGRVANLTFSIQNKSYDMATNTTTANIVYNQTGPYVGTMNLKFTQTSYTTGIAGIKDIQIMKPGLSFNAPTFSQQYLDHFSRFSTLRFMDWLQTNGSLDSLWSDRVLPTSLLKKPVDRGIAWEYCIELANTLNKDMWINIPHKANDDYIMNLATLIKNTLNPNLHVYVEYSNELWNGGFTQTVWNRKQAVAYAAIPGSPLTFDGQTNQYNLQYRQQAKRSKEISEIFKNVFGASAINNQVRIVYGVQVTSYDNGKIGMDFINDYYGSPSQWFYGITGAPYFNSLKCDYKVVGKRQPPHETEDSIVDVVSTPAQIIDTLNSEIERWFFPAASHNIKAHASQAKFYGLKFIAYEGGPDTYGINNIQSKKQAMESPQIIPVLIKFLNYWYAYGADGLFNWFSGGAGNWDTKYGTWSLTQNFEYSNKLRAIDSVLNAMPPTLSVGIEMPSNFDARLTNMRSQTWQTVNYFVPNFRKYDDYLIRVPSGKAGVYGFSALTAATTSTVKVDAYIDGQLIQNLILPNTGNLNVYQNTPEVLTPFLDEGLHTIRLKWINTNLRLDTVKLRLITPCLVTGIKNEIEVSPSIKAAPNPLNSTTLLSYELESTQQVNIKIYDVTGKEVEQLVSRVQLAGSYTSQWDASKVDNGIYFAQIQIGNERKTIKLMVVK